MTKLFLVRHGQTPWNKEQKFQGHTDTGLSEEGIKQASLVADRLVREKLAAVYTSDLGRALITAQTIALRQGIPVNTLPDLREIKFGEWEGLTYSAIYEKWPAEWDGLFSNAGSVIIPGGESFNQLKERAMQAIAAVVEKHPDENVAVVSHGGTIRTIICAALGIDFNHLWDIRQDNTAVSVIEYYGERVLVSLLNDTHHLW